MGDPGRTCRPSLVVGLCTAALACAVDLPPEHRSPAEDAFTRTASGGPADAGEGGEPAIVGDAGRAADTRAASTTDTRVNANDAPVGQPRDARSSSSETALADVPRAASKLTRVLAFTRTTGYRHGSIDAGVKVLQALGAANGFVVDHTEDSAKFTDETLSVYQVVVWLNTTGRPLDTEAQRQAFERFIRGGGGFVGTHSAADTWGGRNWEPVVWPWYGKLLGGDAFFDEHRLPQAQTLVVDDKNTNATRHLPASFPFSDEWYDFQKNPRPVVKVLLSLVDPRGRDHPITWYHEFDGGRAFYTGLGHRRQTFEDPRFQQLLLASLRWAAGGEM